MDIDKRLEKLVERHEALTQAVELSTRLAMARMDRQEARTDRQEAAGRRTDERLKRAIALAANEDLAQRKRTKLLDIEMKKLADAQRVTEVLMQRFLASRTNGHK